MHLWALSFHINEIGSQKLSEFSNTDAASKLKQACERHPHIDSYFYLATCNRVELLLSTSLQFQYQNFLDDNRLNQLSPKEFFSRKDIIKHYISVMLSRDSLVFGENQIQGQFIKAYEKSLADKHLNKNIAKLLQLIVNAAKNIRQSTFLKRTHNSVATIAANQVLQQINSSHKILFIGAGDTNQLFARYVLKRGFNQFLWCNRTDQKAKQQAGEIGGEWIPWSYLENNQLPSADVVVLATNAGKVLFKQEHFLATQPQAVIDLSMPYNCDPSIKKNVKYFLDIDCLKELLIHEEHNYTQMKKELDHKISNYAYKILKDYNVISHDNLFTKEIESTQFTYQNFLENKLPTSLEHLPKDQLADLMKWSQTLVKKITHDHLQTLKEVVSDSYSEEKRI